MQKIHQFYIQFLNLSVIELNRSARLKKCIYLGKSGMAKKLYEHQYKLFNPLYCSTKYTARNSEELISRYVEVLREEMIQRSSKLENDSYFILSDEAIFDYTNYNAELNTFLLKSVLNKLRDSLESFCEISISILITFREQYSLLRSSYAHGYSLLVDRFPTFDKFLKYGIKNPYSQLFGCLWYDQIYTQLKSVYKEERVIMVPYEFLHENPAVFLEKSLLNFGVSDLDELKKISYLVGDKPININHTDMGVYNLRGRTNWHRLTRYAWQKTDHIDPETKFLSFLKFAKHLLDPFFKTGVVCS